MLKDIFVVADKVDASGDRSGTDVRLPYTLENYSRVLEYVETHPNHAVRIVNGQYERA